MEINTDLQLPFAYNEQILKYLIIIVISITIIIISIIIIRKYKNKLLILKKKILKKSTKKNKEFYLKKLNIIKNQYKSKQISDRKVYYSISALIRDFVYYETNIKTHTFSLDELKELNMPELYSIIQQIYNPEFAKYSHGNVIDIIDRISEVIKKWKY